MSSIPVLPYSLLIVTLSLVILQSESAPPQAFRRDPGHPQWHHGAFHDVRDSVRSDVRRMLHTRAQVFNFRIHTYVHTCSYILPCEGYLKLEVL